MKKRFLKNFAKCTGKHLCQSLFFNKAAGLRSILTILTILKKRLRHSCFPVNTAKLLRKHYFEEHLRMAASE